MPITTHANRCLKRSLEFRYLGVIVSEHNAAANVANYKDEDEYMEGEEN